MTETPRRLTPKQEVVRRLYLLSGNQCAFPDCTHPIILHDGTYVGELCHIRAAEHGGERFDSSQTNEDRRSYDNLMFLCHDHHVITNDVSKYSAEQMAEIKANHESRFAKGIGAIERAEGIQISDSILAIGGSGGLSIAAGGGGGAAIGDGARAGDGGSGGCITGLDLLDLESLLAAVPKLSGSYGAGGQGAPAMGDGSIAGDGGGGGNLVAGTLNGEILEKIGVAKILVRVGAGGIGGNDGQPSGIDLIDDQGNILVSINAPGGHGGDMYKSSLHRGSDQVSRNFVQHEETYIKAAFFSNAVQIHENGLFSVLSGGWDFYRSDRFPVTPSWPIIIHLSYGGVRPGGTLNLKIVLIQPDKAEVELEAIEILRDNTTSIPSTVFCRILNPEITSPGLWSIAVRSVDRELIRVPIDVRQVP
jgi:hypothetical protein